MAKQYKALAEIGRWFPGDIIGDLPDDQIKQLLKDGLIEEIKVEPKLKKQNVGVENAD